MITTSGVHQGYLHPGYATSFAEFGIPYHLPCCDGWLLQRAISSSPYHDAMGCYPLFCCRDWSKLGRDLDRLGSEIVSLVVVSDPFSPTGPHSLRACFDTVIPYKDHYVAELDRPAEQIVKKSHQATVRKALRNVEVTVCEHPQDYLDEWVELFRCLVLRHNIRGLRAFSRPAFEIQLAVPGMVMFAARSAGELVGLDLWYVQGDVAYGHLVAFNESGYAVRASYATKWYLMEYFQDKVRWIDFGGGSGETTSGGGGLTAFKQGWSSGTRPTYLCTRIFNQPVYDELTRARGLQTGGYFPAYRQGEMT